MERMYTIKVSLQDSSKFEESPIYKFGGWVGEKLKEGTDKVVVEPIVEALTSVLKAILYTFLSNLPMFFTLAGLVCFILTMMFGKQKPYMWGLAFWGLSALIGVLNVELGIK